MKRAAITALAGGALIAAILTPVAQASLPETTTPVEIASGQDCVWGTETESWTPPLPTSRGYLRGDDWHREHEPPVECAIGPAWAPLMQHYPYSKLIAQSAMGGRATTNVLCSSLEDPRCSPDDWAQILADAVAGYCDEAADFNCVESLEVIDAEGSVQQARYVSGFPETPPLAESLEPGAFLPAGGSVPLWEYSTAQGTARILSIGMTSVAFRPVDGRWQAQPDGLFSFALMPVRMEPRAGVPKPAMVEQVDPSTGLTGINRVGWGDPQTRGCAAFDEGLCAIDVAFPEGVRYRVSLRLRDTAAMYLNGAVDAPVAYSDKIEGGHRFVIEAAPSPVIGMAGWIPKAQIPRDVIDDALRKVGARSWEVDFDAASYRSLGRGGADALTWLQALLPYFGDRASFIVDAWYVENTPSLGRYTSQCTDRGKGEFIGIVASNATAYTGDPPTYDAKSNSLRYEVAAPHFQPDGTTLNRGRYSINMNADFVKCLLGVDKVPTSARIELIYPEGEASAATLAVRQDKNWLRLVYENFTFSNPTVSVKFPKTLTCVKGKGKKAKTKKFTAFQCPKGWRPKR